MRRLAVLCVVVGLACVVGQAAYAADYQSVILDFEDLWQGGTDHGQIPEPYATLYWPDSSWITKYWDENSGFYYTIQGNVGIHSASGIVVRSLHGPISLLTARLGAGWNEGLLVHVQANRNGEPAYDFWLTLSVYGGDYTLNICNVTGIRFTPYLGSGTPVFPPWEGSEIVADNLEIVFGEIPAPAADAGPDQTVEQTSPSGAQVTLDGSASDPGVSYVWSLGGVPLATGAIATVALPSGVNTVQLTVTDELGLQGTDTCVVTVRDTIPPTGQLTVLQSQLVPPKGKSKLVRAAVVSGVSDACTPYPAVTIDVKSDERLVPPTSGAKNPDYVIVQTGSIWEIWLAAVSSDRTPRHYYVSATLADSAANTRVLGPETITVASAKPGKGLK